MKELHALVDFENVEPESPLTAVCEKLSGGRGSPLLPIRDEGFSTGRDLGHHAVGKWGPNAFHRR